MSKSKGNFYTARDVFEGKIKAEDGTPAGQKFHPAVLRYELIKSHYRANMNFTLKGLLDSRQAVNRFLEFRRGLESRLPSADGYAAIANADVDLCHPVLNEFAAALADDLNISAALAVAHQFAKANHSDPQEALAVWQKINSVLSIAPINEGIESPIDESQFNPDQGMTVDEALDLCRQMDTAKSNKDYSTSDQIRKQLIEAGFEVQQTKEGSTIKKQLA